VSLLSFWHLVFQIITHPANGVNKVAVAAQVMQIARLMTSLPGGSCASLCCPPCTLGSADDSPGAHTLSGGWNNQSRAYPSQHGLGQ